MEYSGRRASLDFRVVTGRGHYGLTGLGVVGPGSDALTTSRASGSCSARQAAAAGDWHPAAREWWQHAYQRRKLGPMAGWLLQGEEPEWVLLPDHQWHQVAERSFKFLTNDTFVLEEPGRGLVKGPTHSLLAIRFHKKNG
jgi:hypothetical protein